MAVSLAVSKISLLLQQCLKGTDPEMSLLLASSHPPTSFPVAPSETSQLHLASETSQRCFFSLAPYCQATISSQICQKYSTKVEAIVNSLVNLHLWVSYT